MSAVVGGTAIANVASNDSTNGVPSTLGATGNSTVAQSGTWPTGITLNPTTGAISVVAGTTPGAYPVAYTLCDKLTPTTCATIVDTVFVTPSVNPAPENGTVSAVVGGTAIANVASNDSTNGVPSTLGATGNSTVAQSGTWPTGITLNPTTGAISVVAGTTPGAYLVAYTLCDKLTPTTCATIVDTVFVTPSGLKSDFDVVYVGDTVTGLLSTNDNQTPGSTYGMPSINPNNPSSCMPVISSTGSYSFTCNTPGTYTFWVPVCEPAPSTICTNVPFVIIVTAPNSVLPIANNDNGTTLMNTPITLSITGNDQCRNGVNCILSTPTVVTTPTNGSYNPIAGVYTPNTGFTGVDSFRYSVCDNQTIPKCDSAWVYITVKPLGSANTTTADDDYNEVSIGSTAVGNALDNDTDPESDGQTTVPQTTTVPGKGTLVLLSSGEYTFTPFTGFTGSVSFPYTTCDNGTPQACANATIHILVNASSPLAVNMQYFTTKVDVCNVALDWGTSQEVNSDHFNVLRKAENATTFELIGTVKAAGKSSQLRNYNYIDESPAKGTYEYKIESVDMDNQTKYSETRTVKIACTKDVITVYPNPATDVVHIDIVSPDVAIFDIKFTDMSGRTILNTQTSVENNKKTVYLSITSVANGIYNVQITNRKSFNTETFKIQIRK